MIIQLTNNEVKIIGGGDLSKLFREYISTLYSDWAPYVVPYAICTAVVNERMPREAGWNNFHRIVPIIGCFIGGKSASFFAKPLFDTVCAFFSTTVRIPAKKNCSYFLKYH